ncbi:MAG: hypothetical protein ACRDF0_10065 [Candidatus Limnocylindria bacterium]
MATTTELEARIAALERRIAELQAERSADSGLAPLLDRMFPPDFRRHMRAARNEQLLALRSFLDRWIEEEQGDRSVRRRESISVE